MALKGIIPKIQRFYSELHQQADIKPKTYVASGGKGPALFTQNQRTREGLKKFWKIYVTGGIYAQAIDIYAQSVFANGYRFEGPDNLVKIVEDNFAQFNFDSVGTQAIIQALVFGDSIQEIVGSRGNQNVPVSILIRDSSTFDIDSDQFGRIKSFTQDIVDKPKVTLLPKQVVHIQLLPSCDVYGISLIARAYDDIMRDAMTSEATAAAIKRHGFMKWHIKVGMPGEDVDDDVIDAISSGFEDIETDNEFTTTADVDIIGLDAGGLQQAEEYSNVSLMRVAAALGVPEELLGIRRGSTDATAVVRVDTFLRTKISAIQRTIAREYTLSYIDQLVTPGQVKLIFNDVREEAEVEKAEWISKMLTATNTNPEAMTEMLKIFPAEWIQSQFNIQEK